MDKWFLKGSNFKENIDGWVIEDHFKFDELKNTNEVIVLANLEPNVQENTIFNLTQKCQEKQ